MTVLRIKVDKVNGKYLAVKDYGDDLGYLEEIGGGQTPVEAIDDLLRQNIIYDDSAYHK